MRKAYLEFSLDALLASDKRNVEKALKYNVEKLTYVIDNGQLYRAVKVILKQQETDPFIAVINYLYIIIYERVQYKKMELRELTRKEEMLYHEATT